MHKLNINLNRGENTMFHGSIPALVTPFKNGAVDYKAFANLIERQISGGSSALVPVGTTGESATLPHAEQGEVIAACVQVAAGRVPVLAGCGSNATAEVLHLIEQAKIAGADAALVVAPYYNCPDQAGLLAHYGALDRAALLPIILYNVPGRTVTDIAPETVGKLARLPNIAGIKDATGDLPRVSQQAALIGDADFVQISGDDPSALGHRAMGGVGCISVTANIVPEECAAMHAAFEAGDLATAQSIEQRLIGLHKALFASPSPGPAKYALGKMDLCSDDVRLPIVRPDSAACERMDRALVAAGVKV